MVKTIPTFRYTISSDRTYGSERIERTIYIMIENSPRSDDNCFEHLSVEDVRTLRDVCNKVLEEIKYEDERHQAVKVAAESEE